MQPILQNSLLFGIILSLFMSIIIFLTLWVNPKMWAERAPEDIRQTVGPIDESTLRQKRLFGVITLSGMLLILLVSIFQLNAVVGGLTFWSVFLNILIIATIWNLVDLILIDWLLLVVIQPKFIYMPGTEELKGFKDLAYHFRGFLKGLVISVVASLLIAGITTLVVWIIQ